WWLLLGVRRPVLVDPIPQGLLIHTPLAGDRRHRTGRIHHHFRRLPLVFGSVRLTLIRHGHPLFRTRTLVGSLSGRSGAPHVVLGRMRAAVRGAWARGALPPTGQALSTAGGRLVGDPMREVFEQGAGPGEPTLGSLLFGLLTTAFDGTVADLAATAEIA